MRPRITRPITDVKERPCPDFIWNYEPVTGKGPLHISDKLCRQGVDHKSLTRCGRAMRPDHSIDNNDKLEDFRLCARCGNQDDFVQAKARHDEWWQSWQKEQQIRREQEMAERHTAYEAKVTRAKRFAGFLVAVGLRVGVEGAVIKIERDGYKYELREIDNDT